MPNFQTVTIAQALASNQSSLIVQDTAANIAQALPNPALVARVSSFNLSGPGTIGAAASARLASLGAKFVPGQVALTVLDTLAAMTAQANAAGLALATSRQIADAAYNLLAAPAGSFLHINAVTLTGAPTLSMAQLGKLEALPGFGVAQGTHVLLADALSAFIPALGLHAGWFASAAALSVRLDGGQIGAAGVAALAALVTGGKTLSFVAGGTDTTLNVTASAHDLATSQAALNRLATLVGLHFTVSNDGSAVTAADAQLLTGITGFAPAAHTLYVADTGAAISAHAAGLFNHGFPSIDVVSGNFAGIAAQLLDPTLHVAQGATVSMTGAPSLTAAQTQTLALLPGFTLAQGASLAVFDTVTHILAHASALGAATAITVTDAETVSPSDLAILGLLAAAHDGNFSLGGHSLIVAGTAPDLLSLPGLASSLATGFLLTADAGVSAAQAQTLFAAPGFSAGGHMITITDSASALLALPQHDQALSGHLLLAADQTVTASQLTALAALGAVFSANGHELTASDSAANLLALSPASDALASSFALTTDATVTEAQFATLRDGLHAADAGHALTVADSAANLLLLSGNLANDSATVMTADATVSAAGAAALAALPGFATGGHALTITDSAANLLALQQPALGVASAEILQPGAVTLTASQAAGLVALGHFSAGAADITVQDSVAALTAGQNAAWAGIAAAVTVVDSAANLAAAWASPLLQNAGTVALSGNATITAQQAAHLAAIPAYQTGSAVLTVTDGAAAIVQNEPAILQVATIAVVTDAGPVSAAQADTLSVLSGAGKLVFQGGDQLTVADQYAALTSPDNAAGLALASNVAVLDSAANLVAASGHDWGTRAAVYDLSANAVISGAQAIALAGLGSHFNAEGHTLAVQDSAANVVAAASALASLGIHAAVADSAAAIGAHAVALQGLGAALSAVSVTDSQPVTAATAAALAPFAGVWAGPALAVQDNASGIETALAALQTLGAHLTIGLTDSAAAIGPDAADLAALGDALTISLTDTLPVSASVAAALAPLTGQLGGNFVPVSDTASAIAAHAVALGALGEALGFIYLSGGNAVTAVQAAALAPLDGHLGFGSQHLAVSGSAADIAANAPGLLQLRLDGHVASLTDSADTAAAVAAQAATLNALGASVTIMDTQAHIMADIAALSGVTGLSAVTVSDALHPIFALTLAQYAADAATLALVTNVHTLAVTDSADAIAADLASPDSALAAITGPLTISILGGGPLVLTQAVALAPAVAAILPDLIDPLVVTGADLDHLASVLALNPVSVSLSDTSAHIQADLASGASSIVADLAVLGSIMATDAGPITLTAAQALAANVDDGPASVFGLLTGATLAVTQASVAQLAALQALNTPPATIAVSDSAAAIAAALTDPHSAILAQPGTILSLHVNDGNAVTLTEAQDLAAGVNDGAHAALTKLSGGAVDVTAVATADLAAVEAGARAPDQVSVTDTGAHITAALPALLADLANLGAITVSSGTVVLTASQAMQAHVADGAGSLVSLLPGQAYAVSGATIAQVAALSSVAQPPASIAVTDSSAALAADLTAGTSQWAAHVGSVTVTGGTLTLTDAQADFIILNGRSAAIQALGGGQSVDITGVPVADLATLAQFGPGGGGAPVLHLELADTAASLAADLAAQAPLLTADAAVIASITLTGAGGTLSPDDLTAVANIADLITNGVTIPVSGDAAGIAGLGHAARLLAGSVTVVDSAAHVQGALDTLQGIYGGQLAVTLTDHTPVITVNAATYQADQPTIDAITNSACVQITGNAADIAAIEPALATDAHVAGVQITDSALAVVSNLSEIAALGSLASVTLTDSGSIGASLAQALTQQNLAHLDAGSVIVADTGSQIAALAESSEAGLAFLFAQGAVLTGTSNVSLLDAQALFNLGGALSTQGNAINIWDTASHLTQPGTLAALAALGGAISGIYLKTSNGAVTLTASGATGLLAIPGISIDNPDSSVNALTVSDSAAHLEAASSTLQTELGSIAYIVINASATVGGATLTDLQGLGATTASGVALTLSDSAANILTASLVSASVQASAYSLNASANISAANAVALAALPNFAPAGHTLTVALGADTGVTVGQANNLAGLGSALVVTGHDFTVSGSAASLAGLSAGGAIAAHVALTDTLANIAALSSTSPLLTGTLAITDAEALTASQATAFLSLLNAAGVQAGNIAFGGHVETITDSVANLRALSASPAWTENAGLQSHFALVADDTASVLANPANAAFLDTLTGQMLAATSNVTANVAASLAALSNISLGGHGLIVSDSADNLLLPANASGLSLATSVTLNAAGTVGAQAAETLLQLGNFHLTQALSVTDTSANLLDGTLSGVIAGHALVQVSLAAPETLDAQTAAALVSLQGFADSADMHIVDSSSYLLAPGASAAEAMAASVSLDGNETMSANTILRLSEIPHFIADGGTVTLAGNDFANAPTLQAIAGLGSHFSEGGHALSLTQDDLGLTPGDYAAIQADGFTANGHVISALLLNNGLIDANNLLSLSATGVAGATVNVYGAGGSLISATHEANAGFVVTAPDPGAGGAFSITETVAGVESAPVVVLDAGALENAVSLASSSFALSGEIQVDSGKYINLYTAGAQLPNAPSLVYDPHAHTISLDIPNSTPVTLITLGASTTPGALDPSEILVKHHS